MSTYTGVTNFQKTVRFFGLPCTWSISVQQSYEDRDYCGNSCQYFTSLVVNGHYYKVHIRVEAITASLFLSGLLIKEIMLIV